MDSLLDFVLDLYRVAQDAPVTEFPDLALEMLKSVVVFRTATWSEAKVALGSDVQIQSVHLHKEPTEMRTEFSAVNQKHTRAVMAALAQPGRARVLHDSLAYFHERDEEPMRKYIKRYGHERNLLITDTQQWLSLYSLRRDPEFSDKDCALVGVLLPHLAEALTINRDLALARQGHVELMRDEKSRALIDREGVFLHCGARFRNLLREGWPGWAEPRLPRDMLENLERARRITAAGGSVEIAARPFGGAILLVGRHTSPLDRLSPRELTIAREFGVGKSHKTIARDLDLAPATVRNVLQRAYRKLGIDNKAALARLLDVDR